MKYYTNKKIYKIKLTVTTRCNLECPYCFVKKTNEDIKWKVAKNAIDLLNKSPGKNKLLSIYGGEPLLRFSVIKKIVNYATATAKRNKKKLDISICSNLTLLQKTHLGFLRKNDIKIICSLVGKKGFHDKVRIRKNKAGTHQLVLKKLHLLRAKIPKKNVGVSFCILPSNVAFMMDNFLYLLNLGFSYINFEIIRDYEPWQVKDMVIFYANYKKIILYMLANINKRNFIFVNYVNWEISRKRISENLSGSCPFNYSLEAYPNGDVAFSPFLLNDKEKEKYIIANLNKKKGFLFANCIYSKTSEVCRRCIKDYFKPYNTDKGADAIHRIYSRLSLLAAMKIIKESKSKKIFKEYIEEIKGKVCF